MTDLSPTPELLRKLLYYQPDTGRLFWKPRAPEMFSNLQKGGSVAAADRFNSRFAGKETFLSGCRGGYLHGTVCYRILLAHRVIWAMQTGRWPQCQVDHVNNCRSDNRWPNLREATVSENACNRKSRAKSTSDYLGVCWDKSRGKWMAGIRIGGRKKLLGRFPSEVEAAKAYDAAAAKFHGEYANLNFSELVQ